MGVARVAEARRRVRRAEGRLRSRSGGATRADAGAPEERGKPEVVVAGGGIGGLATALALQRRGVPVRVLEKVKEYKPFGGPIQLAGNAMSTMEAIDPSVGQQIIESSTVTGDRVNGLIDGRTGEWYCRFDTRKPARKRGLPLTLVISRYRLLDILRNALPDGVVEQQREVIGYRHAPNCVYAQLSDGSEQPADVLIGSDGIHSGVRQTMKDNGQSPTYSGYTCYTATCDYEPPEHERIGYRVYLGYKQYFVCSDVGNGQTQWYCFRLVEPGQDHEADKRDALLHHYSDWCENVRDIIAATSPSAIERRDVYDHVPTLRWTDGRVALLGDSAHAMQPNMGQGGCQAIEDAYLMAKELGERVEEPSESAIRNALRRYEAPRRIRSAAVTGFARMAALLATFYRHYLGDHPYFLYNYIPGSYSFWKQVQKLRIPHPGRVFGQIGMMTSIDFVLDYIQGKHYLDPADYTPKCQLEQHSVDEEEFKMRGIPGVAN